MMNMFSGMGGAASPSLSDIAAVTGNNRCGNDGWGDGNGWWVLIILFALFGGWGRGAYGNDGGNGGNCNCATAGDIQRGFDNQSVINKLNGLENGICSLGYDQLAQMNGIQNTVTTTGYALQNTMNQNAIATMQDTNALSRQLADCCCENRQAIAQVRYDMATDTCAVTTAISNAARDITDNANANYRSLHDEFVAFQLAQKDEKIAEQASLIQSLNLAQSQANQNTYINNLVQDAVNTLRPCPTPAYITCNPWASQAPYGSCSCNSGCGQNNGCCGY